jgi:CBS domain containing-hemolysin-like protein
MTQSYKSGEINETELSYMENIFAFDERVAKDIMIPRTQIISLNQTMIHEEILAIVTEHQYTRYPVTDDGNKDHMIGFANVKEMLTDHAAGRQRHLADSLHELVLIHEITPLQDALLKMQSEGVHIALVIDEYGGTAGLITMEDILEEIVGEIRDEFDADETPDILPISKTLYHINGRVLLEELEHRFGLEFSNSEDVDTIGGWFHVQDTDLKPNDSFDNSKSRWTVLEMDNHQILKVSLELLKVSKENEKNN